VLTKSDFELCTAQELKMAAVYIKLQMKLLKKQTKRCGDGFYEDIYTTRESHV
jgi:hypothetical protein